MKAQHNFVVNSLVMHIFKCRKKLPNIEGLHIFVSTPKNYAKMRKISKDIQSFNIE